MNFQIAPPTGYANGFIWNAANQTWDSAIAPRAATIPISSDNVIINGAFDIWQRGTSFTVLNAYTADRWICYSNASGATTTFSRQTFTPGESPVSGGNYYFRYAKTAAGSAETYNNLLQWVEDVSTLAGKTTTISFWAKADAARTVTVLAEQNFGTGGSATVQTGFGSVALTTSWQRFTVSGVVPSISGKTVGANNKLGIVLQMPFNVTFTIDLFGVQAEEGAAATAFRRNAPSAQGELAACQRYFYKLNDVFVSNTRSTIDLYQQSFKHPVVMRAIPTMAAGATYRVTTGNAGTVTVGGGVGETNIHGIYFYNGANNWTSNAEVFVTAEISSEL